MFDYEKYSPDHDWYESVFDMAKEAASIIGIDIDQIYYSGFWSQGDGASFTGSYQYRKGAAAAIRAGFPTATELHSIADALQRAQRKYFYGLSATITRSGRYSHEMTMSVDVETVGGRSLGTADYSRGVYTTAPDEEAVIEAMRDFARWIYSTLEKEYEYQSAWQLAAAWETAAETATKERAAARQLVHDMRAHRRADVPFSICNALRAAVRARLAAMVEALEERREIASNFNYWDDGKPVDVESFAAANL